MKNVIFIIAMMLSIDMRAFALMKPKLYLRDQLPMCHNQKFWWHFSFPAVGLDKNTQVSSPWPSIAHNFTLHELAPLRGRGVRLVIIDTGVAGYANKAGHYKHPDISAPYKRHWGCLDLESEQAIPYASPIRMLSHQEYNPALAHGTHLYGIITAHDKKIASSLSMSPRAQVIMIKAFNDQGTSTKSILIKAVKKAVDLKADILLLSLKIDADLNEESPASVYLNELLQKIPYTVAAAGNGGCGRLGYPARFNAVTMTVGAFGFDESTSTCFLAPFSQYEPGRGPLFLAPGVDILSTAIPTHEALVPYLFLSGTSSAAALVAGCLALALAQFGVTFSKEQILTIFKASAIVPPTIPYKASLHGILDMRSALLMMHILKSVKKTIRQKQFNERFPQLVAHLKQHIFTQATASSSLKRTVRDICRTFLHDGFVCN